MALIKTNARSASALDATILTGILPAISGASLTGLTSGLTESDMWVLTANITGDTEPITTFSRVDDDGQGHMGTGMSHSSGNFTFPSTGFWYVQFTASYYRPQSDSICHLSINTDTTRNENIARSYEGVPDSNEYSTASINCLLDITDLAHGVSFAWTNAGSSGGASSGVILGADGNNLTTVWFAKLGDT